MTPTCAHCGKPATNVPAAHVRRAKKRGHRVYCGRACASLGRSGTLEERFWPKVNKTEGCWEWIGAKRPTGYGLIWAGTHTVQAHIASLMLSGLPIPDYKAGTVVDHICRNRGCVRPDHLRIVPVRVNATENNNSPFALNKRKTHCKYGHPLSGPNVRLMYGVGRQGIPTINRLCLACYGPGGMRKGKNAIRATPEESTSR